MLKKLDKCLVFCSAILLVIGLVMIFSASNVTSYMTYAKSPYNFFIRQFIFLIISLIISFFILKINTKVYHYFSFILMLVIMGLLIVVLIYGKMTNQARSWFNLFGIATVQPSEFAKVITIVWFSCFYSIKENCVKLQRVIIPLIFALGNALLIAIQPDLGTAVIYVGIVFLMFLVLPISKKIKRNSFLGILGIIVVALLLLLNNGVKILFERQLERLRFAEIEVIKKAIQRMEQSSLDAGKIKLRRDRMEDIYAHICADTVKGILEFAPSLQKSTESILRKT